MSRLEALRAQMRAACLDALIVPTADPHLSEYVPEHWASRAWLTGFHGSAGQVVVTEKAAALFTDSRYWIRAEEDLKGSSIELIKSGAPGAPSVPAWLALHLAEGARVGLDPALCSIKHFGELADSLLDVSLALVEAGDLFEKIWQDRPPRPMQPIKRLQGASACTTEKLAALRNALQKSGCQAFVSVSLDEIAWLLNLRGSDVDYNPVFLANLIVLPEQVLLFTEASRVSPELIAELKLEGVEVRAPETFISELDSLHVTVSVDPTRVTAALAPHIRHLVEAPSEVTFMKSRKTDAELESIRKAMLTDGVALVRFQMQLEAALAKHELLTEMRVAEMLHEQRQKDASFIGESFETISAFGQNAALPHYTPSCEHDAELTQGLLLVDSGAQYVTGTTDITRMFAIGALSAEQRKGVTTVLKGHIALARAQVPVGTSGAQLDAYARAPLWQAGWDYGHGTGHGVGYILNVHEGPFHISPRSTATGRFGLAKGIVVSNEPGLYLAERWGVRIENLMAAVEATHTEFGAFLKFETLTLAPIDVRTIEPQLLSQEERQWLNDYHRTVFERLSPLLNASERAWLSQAVQPV